jgi:hypothetical protein
LAVRVDGGELQHAVAQAAPRGCALAGQVELVAPQLAGRLQPRVHVPAEAAPQAARLPHARALVGPAARLQPGTGRAARPCTGDLRCCCALGM